MNSRDIERAEFSGKDQSFSLGNGLYIRIRKSSKTFIHKSKIDGKVRVKTLGTFPEISLKKAKLLAVQTKDSLSDAGTLSNHIDNYYQDRILVKNKRPLQALRYLNIIKAKFGKHLLDNITKRQLASFISEYSKGRTRAGEAMRVHLLSVFNDAFERDLVSVNPMVGITSNVTGYVKNDRERLLTDDEIRAVWGWDECDSKRVIQFILLTGLRISEVLAGYVDGDKFRVDDTKTSRPHWVYLTDTAKALLPMPTCTATNVQAWLQRKQKNDPQRYKPHDCRRTFSTRLNDAGVEPHVIEKCLNHTLAGVMKVYNRAEYEDGRTNAALKMEQLLLDIVNN